MANSEGDVEAGRSRSGRRSGGQDGGTDAGSLTIYLDAASNQMASDRRTLLYAALAAVLVKSRTPELALVHSLLDSWRGIGFIIVGMLRHGFDLTLTSYQQGWRATFLHRSHVYQPWVGPSPHVVAHTVAGCPRGRVARAEHTVR